MGNIPSFAGMTNVYLFGGLLIFKKDRPVQLARGRLKSSVVLLALIAWDCGYFVLLYRWLSPCLLSQGNFGVGLEHAFFEKHLERPQHVAYAFLNDPVLIQMCAHGALHITIRGHSNTDHSRIYGLKEPVRQVRRVALASMLVPIFCAHRVCRLQQHV